MTQANAKGARSTALHSLQWVLGILLSAIPVCVFSKAPEWVVVAIVAAAGLCFLTFIASYVFLLFSNPDALRSETFTLSKMAIEKGLVGDSLIGLNEPTSHESVDNTVVSDQGAEE